MDSYMQNGKFYKKTNIFKYNKYISNTYSVCMHTYIRTYIYANIAPASGPSTQ